MKLNVQIGDFNALIEPYTTFVEKDILLRASHGNYTSDEILDILGISDCSKLTEDAKKYLLYRFREISIGSEINIKFKCTECGMGNDSSLDTDGIMKPGKRNDPDILKRDDIVTDDNLHLFLKEKIDIDDLDIDEFDELKQRIQDNQIYFDFKRKCRCLKCQSVNTIDISDLEYIVDSLSEDTLMTLYKTYNFLNYFGKYTKADVDGMYPFERSIFLGLLTKIKEDLAK